MLSVCLMTTLVLLSISSLTNTSHTNKPPGFAIIVLMIDQIHAVPI